MTTLESGNRSLTLPPATLKKAEPQNPVNSRKIRKTVIFGAKATGNVKIRNRIYEILYMILRPSHHTSASAVAYKAGVIVRAINFREWADE